MDYLAPNGPVYQAGTLSGNPLAMAAGSALIKLLIKTNPYSKLENNATNLLMGMKELFRKKDNIVTSAKIFTENENNRIESMLCIF